MPDSMILKYLKQHVNHFASTALLVITASSIHAQTFGGNPPAIYWRQIITPAAKIIFPQGMDSTALRVASILQQMDNTVRPTLGDKQKQVSIVLQNQTTETNGYVGLAPFRSEFYLTPQQNSLELGGIPWPEMLAVHEFRHVQQYNNFNIGIIKLLSLIYGESGQAIGNEWIIPDWFFEGDAVYNETLVSKQGRGRLPYFYRDYRALWAAHKNYSWMKLRNGSYVDYVPSHYPLGYMLVAYGREKYGDYFWRNVTHEAASFESGFYPIQKAIKTYSGKDYEEFREDALTYFKEQFKDRQPELAANPKQHFIADEEFPAYIDDNALVYLRSAYNHIPVFVIKTGDSERQISTRGLSIDRQFAYRDGKIVYSGYRPDARWGYRNYNEIRVLDINTGKEKAITSKTKYFSPDISPDAKTIAAVQVETSGKSNLHVIDADNGTLLTAIPNPGNLFYTFPKFCGNGNLITAVRNPAGEMAIAQVDIITGRHTYLTLFSWHPIAYLAVQTDTVYFTAASDKDDKLYALSIKDKKLFSLNSEVMQNGIGNYQPAISANKVTWVGFTAYGSQIQQANKKALQWKEADDNIFSSPLSTFNINSLNKNVASDLLNKINDTTGISASQISKYNKGHNLFNFHSLIPDISDPNFTLSLRGENVLNTFQSDLYFNYNSNEGYKQVGFDATYGALFPYLSAGVDYIFDRRRIRNGNHIYWNELNLHGGLQVPLNFSRGKNITGVNFGSDLYYTQSTYETTYTALNRNFIYLNNYATFSTRIQQARQHIYPHFGQSFTFIYKSGLSLSANQFLASGTFYLPGIKANDNLIITTAYQQHGKDDVIGFSNNFPFSRGYTAENLYQLYKAGANYHFPIAYPDAGVGNTVYLLRIRGNAFYEYTRGIDFYNDGSKFKANFRSAGMAVFFDTKFFNQQSLSFGIRYSRLLDDDYFGGTGRNRIELVLPVSFF